MITSRLDNLVVDAAQCFHKAGYTDKSVKAKADTWGSIVKLHKKNGYDYYNQETINYFIDDAKQRYSAGIIGRNRYSTIIKSVQYLSEFYESGEIKNMGKHVIANDLSPEFKELLESIRLYPEWSNKTKRSIGDRYMETLKDRYISELNPLFIMVRDFILKYLPVERKYSDNTIRAYKKSLDLLFDYVKEQKKIPLWKVSFELIDRNMLSGFLDSLENDRGCSAKTRNHRLNCIRAFYKYSATEDITLVAYYNEILKVKTAKVPQTIVPHMSERAVQTILEQPDTSTEIGKRDAFLMLFLYKTGARVQELVDVRLSDIQLGNAPRVLLHGKGAKARAIPLRDDVVQHLKKYTALFHGEEGLYSDQYLFYVVRNNHKKRMTEQNVRALVSKYGTLAREQNKEVPENVHPHLFRHSWAMSLYRNGVELTLISQGLGHAQVETTLIYAHADTEIKRQAIEKAVPETSPLKEYLNAERYQVDDEDLLKRLVGLK